MDLLMAKRFAAPAAQTTTLRKPDRLNDFNNHSAKLVEQKKTLFGTVAMTISAASKQRKHFKERFFACPHHKFAEMNPSVGRSGCAYQGRGFQNMAQLTYVFLFLCPPFKIEVDSVVDHFAVAISGEHIKKRSVAA